MKEQQFARIFIWANTSEQLANSTAENSSVLNIRDVDPLTWADNFAFRKLGD